MLLWCCVLTSGSFLSSRQTHKCRVTEMFVGECSIHKSGQNGGRDTLVFAKTNGVMLLLSHVELVIKLCGVGVAPRDAACCLCSKHGGTFLLVLLALHYHLSTTAFSASPSQKCVCIEWISIETCHVSAAR